MKHINQNTNYWTGNLTGSSDMWWREDDEVKKGRDVVALASYRSAIANTLILLQVVQIFRSLIIQLTNHIQTVRKFTCQAA